MIKERRKSLSSMPYSSQISWKLTSNVGGKFPNVRPIFTMDQKHLVVLTSLHLKIFNLATKQCVRSVSLDSSDITDIYEYDQGKIFISRFNEKSLLLDQDNVSTGPQSIDLRKPILKIVTISNNKLICIIEHHGGLQLAEVSLSDPKAAVRTIISDKNARMFAVSNSYNYFALYSSRHKRDEVLVYQLDQDFNIIGKERVIKRSRPVLCLAVSDTGLLAVGTASGVIDLYYSNGDESITRTLKWHVDSVLALEFSLDGDYLLSGGKERVQVFWQLETGNTQFLPRLDGDIGGIYVNPTSQLYALVLSGEQVLVLSAVDLESRLQVAGVKANFVKTFSERDQKRKKKKLLQQQQLQVDSSEVNERVGDYTCQYYIHPITKHAYFPTKTMSQIQIYNTAKDEQEKVISVASTIQTGKVRSESLIEDPVITHVCFSTDGKWMATVDKRTNPAVDALISKDDIEINLKFWKMNGGDWTLCTRVSSPHGMNKLILDLIPTSNGGFLTAAEDGSVRLWAVTLGSKRTSGATGVDKWGIRKILSSHANTSPAVSLTISHDMSVIALGFENTIYIIDGKKFEIKQTLPNVLGSRVRALKILGTCLVALSKSRLLVWDLLNGRERWAMGVQVPTNGRRLIDFDSVTNSICFAYNFYARDYRLQSKLFFLSLDSPFAIHVESHSTAISAVTLVPGGSSNFSFVDINGRISSMTFGSRVKGSKTVGEQLSTEGDFQHNVLALYASSGKGTIVPSVVSVEDHLSPQNRILTIKSFEQAFENPELSLEAMFENVLSIVNPR